VQQLLTVLQNSQLDASPPPPPPSQALRPADILYGEDFGGRDNQYFGGSSGQDGCSRIPVSSVQLRRCSSDVKCEGCQLWMVSSATSDFPPDMQSRMHPQSYLCPCPTSCCKRMIRALGLQITKQITNNGTQRTLGLPVLTGLAVGAGEQPVLPGSLPLLAVLPGSLPLLPVLPGSLPLLAVLPGRLPLLAVLPGRLPLLAVQPGSLPLLAVLPGSLPLLAVLPGSLPLLAVLPGSQPRGLAVLTGVLPLRGLAVLTGVLPLRGLAVLTGALPLQGLTVLAGALSPGGLAIGGLPVLALLLPKLAVLARLLARLPAGVPVLPLEEKKLRSSLNSLALKPIEG